MKKEIETEYSLYCLDLFGNIYISHVPTYLAIFLERETKIFYKKIVSKIIPYTEEFKYVHVENSDFAQLTRDFFPIIDINNEEIQEYLITNKIIPQISSDKNSTLIQIKKYKTLCIINQTGEYKVTKCEPTDIFQHLNLPFQWSKI